MWYFTNTFYHKPSSFQWKPLNGESWIMNQKRQNYKNPKAVNNQQYSSHSPYSEGSANSPLPY